MILIIDFGAQYSQLIARRVREAKVYSEIVPYTYTIEQIRERSPEGIILSGGPASVYAENAPKIDREIFNLGIPVLGICYGGQFIAQEFGGRVRKADFREYGRARLNIHSHDKLFKDIKQNSLCWMSHTDFIESVPEGFEITASSDSCPVCAMKNEEKKIYAVQFHPEVDHTEGGREIINNFLFKVCEAKKDWNIGDYVKDSIEKIKKEAGDKKALCALSGGYKAFVISHESRKPDISFP
jgi:GMP synthase (glutamine-hydrolysing)